jgi:asparagine synthase (glutamine-hydrolysing)
MCGILGSVNKPFNEVALDLIKHRGPDDGKIVSLSLGENSVTLGHRRLSIQDLSIAGQQPMYSACQKFIIIFNGEIYNHLELRKELNDIEFNGHSDTETIVNYLAKFGIESIDKFNGIYGLALLDIEKEKIYLARDRFGVKPLYYTNSSAFVFSSEIKPILKIVDEYKMNVDGLNSYFTLRYNPSPSTMYKEISKVKPGEVLVYDVLTNEIKKHLNINETFIANIKVDKSRSESYWVDKLSDKFEQAVARQMLSDVEVGSFLSGGLDSALITSIASKYSKSKIKTFCIGFEGATLKDDEIVEARRSAELLGTDHYDLIVNPRDYMKDLEKALYINEEPNGTDSTLAQYQISQLASEHVKVMLAGQGADEMLMGYGRYGAETRREKYLPLIKAANLVKPLFAHSKFHRIQRALYALTEKNEYRRLEKIYTVFTEKERQSLLKGNYREQVTELKSTYDLIPKEIDSSDKMSILDTYTWLSDELLMYGDKTTMATSVEMRVPFLDNDLVETIHQIPTHYKIKDGSHKYILRKMAEKILPNEIIYRPKKGFTMPSLKWFQEDLNDDIMQLLNSDDSLITEYIDRREIEKLILKYKAKKENDERKIVLLMNVEYMLRLLNKKFEL